MHSIKDSKISIEEARQIALNLLSRREHSSAELISKLAQRHVEQATIDAVIEDFQQRNWLNDDRFCEVFIRKRYFDGCGEMRIRQELRQRGIDSPNHRYFQQPEFDWFERCREVYQKKYQQKAILDPKERAKRQRFLQYRGFNFEQIAYAMQSD